LSTCISDLRALYLRIPCILVRSARETLARPRVRRQGSRSIETKCGMVAGRYARRPRQMGDHVSQHLLHPSLTPYPSPVCAAAHR
jgi:hypothetical protein